LISIASPGGGHVVRGFVFSVTGAAVEILTMTHARIRAKQGDVAGARRVLKGILERSPDDPEARALLVELEGKAGRQARVEPAEPLALPEAADARALADRFRRSLRPSSRMAHVSGRVRRLEAWLTRIRGRGTDAG
jgi:hypothetical protein